MPPDTRSSGRCASSPGFRREAAFPSSRHPRADRGGTVMKGISPFLWFNDKAEEAMSFYVSIFKNSKIVSINRYGEAGPGPKGSVMSVTAILGGQEFLALNGGPQFSFTPAISFFVKCETQQEVDELWEKLSGGGKTDRCGW